MLQISNENVNKSWYEEGNVIIFDKIQAEDKGNYSCIATNEAGESEREFFIEVIFIYLFIILNKISRSLHQLVKSLSKCYIQ